MAGARGRVVIDPRGANVVREDFAELIVGDLADERALRAERGEAGERVRRRAARNLARRAHRVVEFLRPVGVDQRHPPVVETQLLDQLVFARGHHVDDGVADRDHVITGFGHWLSNPGCSARP